MFQCAGRLAKQVYLANVALPRHGDVIVQWCYSFHSFIEDLRTEFIQSAGNVLYNKEHGTAGFC